MVLIRQTVQFVFPQSFHPRKIGSCLILTIILNKLKIFATLSRLLKIMDLQIGREKFKLYRRLGIEPGHLNYKSV